SSASAPRPSPPRGVRVCSPITTTTAMKPSEEQPVRCVFCESFNTKCEGYNNNNVKQKRYRCYDCKNRFTEGGKLR
ncbi:hypothetical protein SELMODRAFT_19634, partial [Selaginella moellendorffii]